MVSREGSNLAPILLLFDPRQMLGPRISPNDRIRCQDLIPVSLMGWRFTAKVLGLMLLTTMGLIIVYRVIQILRISPVSRCWSHLSNSLEQTFLVRNCLDAYSIASAQRVRIVHYTAMELLWGIMVGISCCDRLLLLSAIIETLAITFDNSHMGGILINFAANFI